MSSSGGWFAYPYLTNGKIGNRWTILRSTISQMKSTSGAQLVAGTTFARQKNKNMIHTRIEYTPGSEIHFVGFVHPERYDCARHVAAALQEFVFGCCCCNSLNLRLNRPFPDEEALYEHHRSQVMEQRNRLENQDMGQGNQFQNFEALEVNGSNIGQLTSTTGSPFESSAQNWGVVMLPVSHFSPGGISDPPINTQSAPFVPFQGQAFSLLSEMLVSELGGPPLLRLHKSEPAQATG